MDEGAALAGPFEAPSTNLASEQGELKPGVRGGEESGKMAA
jgi:hypothetical protein